MTIVVGFDGSECAKQALAAAADMASRLGDALVVAFAADTPGRVGGEMSDYLKVVEAHGRTVLEEVQGLVPAGVDVQTEVVDGDPSSVLMDLAAERSARMIVVGSRGERPLLGAILGSTPYKLVHRSPVPVLVVPASE